MKRWKLVIFSSLLILGAVVVFLDSVQRAEAQLAQAYGDPLPGLTPEQRALFLEGKETFKEIRTPENGLGPMFNGRSCGECHSTPAFGGSSNVSIMRFGRADGSEFDPLEAQGGPLQHMFATDAECKQSLPRAANAVALRQTPHLFGAGLLEGIPDQAIIDNMNRQDPGVRGRVNMVFDLSTGTMRVGRFGWKAQVASLTHFSGEALRNEMGITNELFPNELAPNGDMGRLKACDPVPDPEDVADRLTGRTSLERIANFMRFLGGPPRGQVTAEVVEGGILFALTGCIACHTVTWTTGPNPVAALHNKRFDVWSDFLLHDVGTGDGLQQGEARRVEVKTPVLWGLRTSAPYLHNGSAATIEESIRKHSNQARGSRILFELLNADQRAKMIAFLESL